MENDISNIDEKRSRPFLNGLFAFIPSIMVFILIYTHTPYTPTERVQPQFDGSTESIVQAIFFAQQESAREAIMILSPIAGIGIDYFDQLVATVSQYPKKQNT